MSLKKLKDMPVSYWADNYYEGGAAPDGLWLDLNYAIYTDHSRGELDLGDESNFEMKKKLFFDVITLMLMDGRMRLAKKGQFLQGTIEEQVQLWRSSFPLSEQSQDEIGGIGTWFFMDDCPAGIVLVYQLEDGTEHLEWT